MLCTRTFLTSNTSNWGRKKKTITHMYRKRQHPSQICKLCELIYHGSIWFKEWFTGKEAELERTKEGQLGEKQCKWLKWDRCAVQSNHRILRGSNTEQAQTKIWKPHMQVHVCKHAGYRNTCLTATTIGSGCNLTVQSTKKAVNEKTQI